MSENEIVRIAAGTATDVEIMKNVLDAEGIPCQVVGGTLDAGLGTAIPNSVELWVTKQVEAKAVQALQQYNK